MFLEKSKLFEYVVLWHPDDQQAKEGKKTEIVTPLTQMIAKEEKAVFMTAVKALPDMYKDQLDQIDVVVRPF